MLLTNILAVVIVLGVLIAVHEFGHFIVAKAVGIQVLRFSLGFGRPLVQWRRGETEYWIAWIPLGGYVKMAGLEEEGMVGELEGGKADAAIDPERTFDKQPLWARMAVILAGVTMNLFLAFVIYTGLIAVAGEARPALTPVDSVDAARLPPGAEGLATLHRGDRIVRINGDSLKTWDDLDEKIVNGPEELRFEVAGRPQPIVIRVARDTAARHPLARAIVPLFPARVGPLVIGLPAQRAGLYGGDVVVKVDDDTIVSWTDMVRLIQASPEKPLTLAVLRGDSLVTGQVSARELGGPIAIAQMSGQAARLGIDLFLQFLAFFSVSLAVLNLLPIPVLDGGHAMFLIAEAILRRPLSP